MKWFKFYGQDYLSDPKILTLSACERSCLITLLSYGSVNDNGLITFLSEEQLMAQAGIDMSSPEWNKTKGVLKKLKSLKIIEFDNGEITIVNWTKRQETNLTGYERVKRYREKKRNDNEDDNTKITSDKNRVDKIRVDKIRKDNTNTCDASVADKKEPDPVNKVLEVFAKINPTLNWGNKTSRKAAKDMIDKFTLDGTIKMAEQIISVHGQPFAPTATTPWQMKEKLAQFKAYFDSKKNNKRNFVQL